MSQLKEINGRYYQEAQVVMLTTDNEPTLPFISQRVNCYGDYNGDIIYKNTPIDGRDRVRHLYIISDEEIKEGDWYFDGIDLVHKKSKYNKDLVDGNKQAKKIVATTDTSLQCKGCLDNKNDQRYFYNCSCIPQPSQAFIKKYCELGGIDEVDLEYEVIDKGFINALKGNHNYDYKLKVDPIHNTVTIHSIKDSWSREEMFQLMDNYQNYLIETDRTVKSFEEWFNS